MRDFEPASRFCWWGLVIGVFLLGFHHNGTAQSLPGVLDDGVPVTGLSGPTGAELRFTLEVPAGATGLNFQLSGGSGDADLYVQFGSAPTLDSYDCRPYIDGNDESCAMPGATAGTWHVLVHGYSAFADVSLVGSYSGGGGGLAATGCPMAHCDPGMSDLVRLRPPLGQVDVVWHRNELAGETAGVLTGLGCSGNGSLVACAYTGPSHNLVVYNYDGERLWDSGHLLDKTAATSAPLFLDTGDIIACDQAQLVRFDASGKVVWSTPLTEGGIPLSPVLTNSGIIVLSTFAGPLYAFDSSDGSLISTLLIKIDTQDPGFFSTLNTVGVRDNRIYLAASHWTDGAPDPDRLSRLFAIELDTLAPDDADRLKVVWFFEYGGPSGASPLVIGSDIFFDGGRPAPGDEMAPHLFALRDHGSVFEELWRRPVKDSIKLSPARDPRPAGGNWEVARLSAWLVRRDSATGDILQLLNVDALVAEPGTHIPRSVLSIAGTRVRPVMILVAGAFDMGTAFVIAIDLARSALLWKVPLPDVGPPFTAGQFPIVKQGNQRRVVFATHNSGARAIGLPDDN